MTTAEFLADLAVRSLQMVKMALADMTDADMLVRPCAGANHANWQLGHLVSSEVKMVSMMPGNAQFPPLPEGFHEMYGHDRAAGDDGFLGKDDLLAVADKVREATVAWMRNLDEKTFAQEVTTPLGPFAPTVGHLAAAVNTHMALHHGQIQVIRRKTGKPVLF